MTTTSAAPCPLHPWIAQPCNICTTTFSVAPAQGEPHDYDALRADALGRICEHGQLARSCDHCDNAREIAELHATVERQALEIAELRAMLQTANQANGRLAELAYKYKWQVQDTCTRAERAEAERDALRADAERYRWLRGDTQKDFSSRWSRWRIEHWASPGPTWCDIRGDDLDAAIDAARKA